MAQDRNLAVVALVQLQFEWAAGRQRSGKRRAQVLEAEKTEGLEKPD